MRKLKGWMIKKDIEKNYILCRRLTQLRDYGMIQKRLL